MINGNGESADGLGINNGNGGDSNGSITSKWYKIMKMMKELDKKSWFKVINLLIEYIILKIKLIEYQGW